MKIAIINLISFAIISVGCGPGDLGQSSVMALDSASSIKIHVSKSFGSERVLLASSSATTQDASFCPILNGQCVQEFKMTNIGENYGRQIFGVKGLPNEFKGDYRVSIGNESREVSFALNDSNGIPAAGRSGDWKSIFLAGDYQDNGRSVVAWDNARRDLADLFVERGFEGSNIKHLARDPQLRAQDVKIGEASLSGMNSAFTELKLGNNDSCFLFMTSHGSRSGFYIEGGKSISPADFTNLLDKHCGSRPTVAIVSACYAGIMLNDRTRKDNRIIFTAASKDKTSNGCSPGVVYTFFDECIVESLNKDSIVTYNDMAEDVKSCIDSKESSANASFPQFYIGAQMKDLKIEADATNLTAGTNPTSVVTGTANGGQSTNNISGKKNLALESSQGDTDLKSVAGSSKFILIDFSSPSCGYCLQFAAMLESNASILGDSCSTVTMVNPGQLDGWNSRLDSRGAGGAKAHSYALKNERHGAALGILEESGASGSVPTPTILLFDVENNNVISKNVGALTEGGLRSFLGTKCGG
jgi:hypothetical protein